MNKYKAKSYFVPRWIRSAIEVLRPRERLPVSVWAEQNRVMPETNAIPGPWRNNVTPYLVEIMDTFSEGDVEIIVFVKPTQVGGTSAMENMLGSLIDQDPGPTMVVYPSDGLAERTVDAKLAPMFKQCKALATKYKESESKLLEQKFTAMTVYLTGANSPADLSSTNIRYLFLDEVDKYQGATKKEADPISLAIERTKTYLHRKRIFITSTPTLRTGHIWKQKEAAEAEKHYFVPCPHCGEFIELKFAQIDWPKKDEVKDQSERAARAVYVCQECGCIITDQDKGKMLREGRWQIVRQTAQQPKSMAFWINTLYSPFTRFSEIAAEFMKSKDDPDLLHNFTNSWLAEPWEDTKLKTSAELVLERQTEFEQFAIPPWAKLITAGVDVQENCLYWTIRAWGDFLTSQNIAHGQVYSFKEIEDVMNLPYKMPDGTEILVELCLIDSGDQTDEVYEFCYRNADWAMPCKGMGTRLNHYSLSTVNKAGSKAFGMPLVLVDGGKYKDMIAGRMRKDNGSGSWMVYKGCDDEYAQQVTAEHKVAEKNGNKVSIAWQLKTSHAANHYLDCEVYAMAAADIKGVRALYLQNGQEQEAAKPDAIASEAQRPPEESWIAENDEWI